MQDYSSYRCIGCGERKQSREACTCPTCGHAMFPEPYDRREQLLEQLRSLVERLACPPVTVSDLSFYREETPAQSGSEAVPAKRIRKEKDDARFPSCDKIYDDACAATTLEVYVERVRKAVAKLKEHLHTRYQQTYLCDTLLLQTKLERWQAQWKQAMAVWWVQEPLPDVELPPVALAYAEIPDETVLPVADEILSRVDALIEKLARFVKVNNLFDTNYRCANLTVAADAGKINVAALRQRAMQLDRLLQKTYALDIFSDGTDELNEMSMAIWGSLAQLSRSSALRQDWQFTVEGRTLDRQGVTDELQRMICHQYEQPLEALRGAIRLCENSEQSSEQSLFERYEQMLHMGEPGDRCLQAAAGEAERRLWNMVGLQSVKNSIKKLKAYVTAGHEAETLNFHMCFYGNPGTGKTEVARVIAGILYENKLLPSDHVVEVDRGGLVGQYVGETSQKTMRAVREAMGGVLFVDEAYALVPDTSMGDYGHEAVATLLKAMEDHRGKFCVILAGYKDKMQDMLSSNPGLRSRIQFELDFPNYSREELSEILTSMAAGRGYAVSENARKRMLDITDVKRKEPHFANAREIRNIIEQTILCHEMRVAESIDPFESIGSTEADRELALVDVDRYIRDANLYLPTGGAGNTRQILTVEEELERLIGLGSVKKMLRKIRAYAKRNLSDGRMSLHMCFVGEPGTGKTEVARLMSRLLYEAGVLQEAKMIETDASGLLGRYVGETAPKVHKKVQEALGGVLFIDEAYALVDPREAGGVAANYGDEAIATLLKEMEDRRGGFCVVFAGYQKQMERMLAANPGLASRVPFTLQFPSYSKDELDQLLSLFLEKQGYIIEEEARGRLLDCMEYLRGRPHYANARTLRNLIEQVIMDQNLRTETTGDNTITMADVEEYMADEGIDLTATRASGRKMGFV